MRAAVPSLSRHRTAQSVSQHPTLPGCCHPPPHPPCCTFEPAPGTAVWRARSLLTQQTPSTPSPGCRRQRAWARPPAGTAPAPLPPPLPQSAPARGCGWPAGGGGGCGWGGWALRQWRRMIGVNHGEQSQVGALALHADAYMLQWSRQPAGLHHTTAATEAPPPWPRSKLNRRTWRCSA